MLRALNIDLSQRFGGASARALGIIGSLRSDRHGLAVLERGETLALARDKGITTHLVGRHRASPLCALRTARVLREFGYNLIDTHNVQAKLWGSLASRLTDVAVVSTLNSWYEHEHGGRLKGRCYQLIDGLTNSRVDMFIAVSEEIYANLTVLGVERDRIALIPNAVSLDPGRIPDRKDSIRRELGVPENAIVCCSAGRLVDAKGYAYLLRAAAQLVQNNQNVFFIVVGGGPLRFELETAIRELGIGRQVRLVGSKAHDETLEYIKSSDIFVLPSITEGTPVALLEAAALSKPIVATRVGGIPQVLTDGMNSRLVEPTDVPGLAEAMQALIDDPGLARDLANNAKQRVDSAFSLDAQVRATHEVYERALERACSRHGRGHASDQRRSHRD